MSLSFNSDSDTFLLFITSASESTLDRLSAASVCILTYIIPMMSSSTTAIAIRAPAPEEIPVIIPLMAATVGVIVVLVPPLCVVVLVIGVVTIVGDAELSLVSRGGSVVVIGVVGSSVGGEVVVCGGSVSGRVVVQSKFSP